MFESQVSPWSAPLDQQLDSEAGFIQAILEDLRGGFRFVPFIGAGLSRASGIPTTQEIMRYLTLCVVRAFGLDTSRRDPWEPRRHDWSQGTGSCMLTRQQLDALLRERMIRAEQSDDLKISSDILREAYGALADWRSALLFLSRIVVRRPSEGDPKRVELAAPDSSVIDSFFRHFVSECVPSLGHRMIQALSRALRFDIILTTNFDDCLESAFAAAGAPLTHFDVPLGATLPPARLVLQQPSIIKMHGGRHGLRADYSLDVSPSEADRLAFRGYLAGRELEGEDAPLGGERVALLLCGLSCRDRRIRALLESSWPKSESGPAGASSRHLYWLCFSQEDWDTAREFRTTLEKSGRAKVYALWHPEHGLFLQQLFQELTHSIPTTGVLFPGLWNLPLPPRIPYDPLPGSTPEAPEAALEQWITGRLGDQIRTLNGAEPGVTQPPIVVVTHEDAQGVVTVCSHLFQVLRHQGLAEARGQALDCLWMDLDNVSEPVGVLLRLALMQLRQCGDDDPICTLDLKAFYQTARHDDFMIALKGLLEPVAARTGRRTVVFLNGLEGGGSHALYASAEGSSRAVSQAADAALAVASVAKDAGRSWTDEAAVKRLYDDLTRLSSTKQAGLHFVILLRHPGPDATSDADRPGARALRVACNVMGDNQHPHNESHIKRDHFKEAKKLLAWTEVQQRDRAATFVTLLTLFRVPCYPASLARIMFRYLSIVDPQGRRTLTEVAEKCARWLRELHERGVVRFKHGGFVWTHSRFKQEWKELHPENRDEDLLLGALVARWYGRLLLASGDPLAAVESIFHAVSTVEAWARSEPTQQGESPDDGWQRAWAVASHARLVCSVVEQLLLRHLSDQFADSALEFLGRTAECALRTVRASGKSGNGTTRVGAVLENLCHDLKRLRLSVYCYEAEYRDVLPETEVVDGPQADPPDAQPKALARQRSLLCHRLTALTRLRDFKGAEKCLRKLQDTMTYCPGWDSPPKSYAMGEGALAARRWAEAAEREVPDRVPQEIRFLVGLLRRRLYCRLHASQVQYLADAIDEEPRADRVFRRIEALGEALWCCEFGLELLRLLPHTDDEFVFRENARLRTHGAFCHAIRASFDPQRFECFARPSSFATAQAMLEDAQAYLDEFPLQEEGADRAKLELRRAEVELLRVSGPIRLAGLARRLRSTINNPPAAPKGEEWKRLVSRAQELIQEWAATLTLDECRKIVRALQDAWVCLGRAEKILKRHRKNRWWWWILLVLKTKVAEYFQAVMLTSPSSDLGANLKPDIRRFVDDELRTNIIATAMTDPFQLARITDALCFRSLVLEVTERPAGSPSVPGSVNEEILKNVYGRLAATLDESAAAQSRYEFDERVGKYAKKCRDTARQLIEILDKRPRTP